MPADLVAVAILVVLATLAAPLTADVRRRVATRRFDALYERHLLRRTGRGTALRIGSGLPTEPWLAACGPERLVCVAPRAAQDSRGREPDVVRRLEGEEPACREAVEASSTARV